MSEPLQDRVTQALEELEATGMIDEMNECSRWQSAMILTMKRGGKSLRVCLDLRTLNRAVLRETHSLATMGQMVARSKDSGMFSLLNVEQTFHQRRIQESSRQITTFSTHYGLYRYRRLVFGLSSSAAVLQRTMDVMLEGVQRRMNTISG